MLLLPVALQASSYGEGLGAEPQWGAGVHELKRLHPAMLRTYGGLDSRMRTRIQRFRNIETHFGVRTETLYDFIGHRLYQVEYNFQQPNDLTFKLASSELVERYGSPLTSNTSALPSGELFEERSLSDLVWKHQGLEISQRQIFSRFVNGTVVRQLFIVMRSAEVLHSDRRPLQLQSDAEIQKAGKLVRIAFAGGINPQRIKTGAALDGVRHVLESADIAVATLDGALASAQGSSPDGPLFAVDEAGIAQLKAGGLDVISLTSPGAVAAGVDAALVGADALQRSGIRIFGFGSTRTEAEKAFILESKGVRIAFLSFTYGGDGRDCAMAESTDTADTPAFSGSCSEAVKFRYDVAARVADAASQADVVSVIFAWDGTGECNSQSQNMLIDAAWNAGADVVTGYRSGTLQALRGAPAKVALTSCGDLLLNPEPGQAQGTGLIFLVEVNSEGLVSYDFNPLLPGTAGSPLKADEKEARRIMDDLRALERRCNSGNSEGK